MRYFIVIVFVFCLGCTINKPIAESKYLNDQKHSLRSFKIAKNQLHPEEVKQSVINVAISRRLASMGYSYEENPSFYVYYRIIDCSDAQKMSQNSTDTLVIIFYDHKNKKEVWQGTLPGISSESPRELLFAVNRVMDNFNILSESMIASINRVASKKSGN